MTIKLRSATDILDLDIYNSLLHEVYLSTVTQ